MAASDCSAMIYKLLLVHQTILAPHFSYAEFPKLRSIGKLSPLCTVVFQQFRNPGGGGGTVAGTGRIGEDEGGPSVEMGWR